MLRNDFSSIIFHKIVSLFKIGQKKCPFFKTQLTFWKFFVESVEGYLNTFCHSFLVLSLIYYALLLISWNTSVLNWRIDRILVF